MPANGLITNGNTRREEQRFFINNAEVPGVQNVDIEYSQPAAPLTHLGCGSQQYFILPSNRFSAQASVSSLFIADDPFISLTGNVGANGYLLKTYANTGQNFSFVSGYLSSYTLNCSVGQIPQLNASFDIFGEAGRIDSTSSPRVASDFASINAYTPNILLKVVTSNSITISGPSTFSTNRVQSFNVGLTCPRNPIYFLGSRFPSRVEKNATQVSLDFAMDLNDYNALKASLFPLRDSQTNISLSFNNSDNNAVVSALNFSKMTFVGESQRTNINSSVSIVHKYVAYYPGN